MAKLKLAVKLQRARREAQKLGYENLRDLEARGTDEHKELVQKAFENENQKIKG